MATRIALDALLERLADSGLAEPRVALRALSSTLAVLGERLGDGEARALAEVLPAELATSVEDVEYDSDFCTDELVERVRRRERTTQARAREHAEIVLRALGQSLDRDRRSRIARALPEEAAKLLLHAG